MAPSTAPSLGSSPLGKDRLGWVIKPRWVSGPVAPRPPPPFIFLARTPAPSRSHLRSLPSFPSSPPSTFSNLRRSPRGRPATRRPSPASGPRPGRTAPPPLQGLAPGSENAKPFGPLRKPQHRSTQPADCLGAWKALPQSPGTGAGAARGAGPPPSRSPPRGRREEEEAAVAEGGRGTQTLQGFFFSFAFNLKINFFFFPNPRGSPRSGRGSGAWRRLPGGPHATRQCVERPDRSAPSGSPLCSPCGAVSETPHRRLLEHQGEFLTM